MARPDPLEILRVTFITRIHFSAEVLLLVVAWIGTSLSAHVCTWGSNQEVGLVPFSPGTQAVTV
jgi:hypothetical protein